MEAYSAYRAWRRIFLIATMVAQSAVALPFFHSASGSVLSNDLENFTQQPFDSFSSERLQDPKNLQAFYRDRNHQPAWIDANKLNAKANLLLSKIKEVGALGLRPEDYHWARLQRLLSAFDSGPVNRAFAVEILLSDAFFTLSENLATGVVNFAASTPDWAVRHRKTFLLKAIENAVDSGQIMEFLESLEPHDQRYQMLKLALSNYQAMQPFPRLDSSSPLRPGMRGPRVARLRKRLVREGYTIRSGSDLNYYDDDLKRAVTEFEASHGLNTNGLVDKKTFAELNVPLSTRIRQIQVNLERLRWLPREMGASYVFVDITDFKLTLFRSDEPVLSMRAIVGDARGKTPMLMAKMQSIDLNPNWRIPNRIVVEEIVPKLIQDPTYLKRKGIKVTANISGGLTELDTQSIDWTQYKGEESTFFFDAPSGTNPLGPIKFIFPNEMDVFLHGTPNHALFDQEQRSLSHGCIRLEYPVALATEVLKDVTPPWSQRRLKDAIRAGKLVSINLPTALPVYLWYRSAWADNDGHIQFRSDIYHWDETVWQAMLGHFNVQISSVVTTQKKPAH